MKRYSIGVKSVRSNKMETSESGQPILIIRVDPTMDENINGEWIKSKDVKEAVCNCAKRADNPSYDWWICPAHGYKRR